jgi:hypothetical protein
MRGLGPRTHEFGAASAVFAGVAGSKPGHDGRRRAPPPLTIDKSGATII